MQPTTDADPGAAAARARVDALLERSARVQLQVIVVAQPDEVRLAARDQARSAAIVAGRGALMNEAVAAARDQAMRGFARSAFSGTWAFTDMSMSVARSDDRVAATLALEEAAMAEVVEDLVDPETLAILRSTTEELASLTAIPTPGSIAEIGRSGSTIHGVVPLALVGGLAILLVLAGLGAASLVTLVLGLVMVAGLAQRRRGSER
jgi:hypothetical protein